MRKIAIQFGDRVRVRFIRGHDVFHELNSKVMRSFTWPLTAITLTKNECTYIMAPVIKRVLTKLKIVNTTKRKVIYDLVNPQGMGFKK